MSRFQMPSFTFGRNTIPGGTGYIKDGKAVFEPNYWINGNKMSSIVGTVINGEVIFPPST